MYSLSSSDRTRCRYWSSCHRNPPSSVKLADLSMALTGRFTGHHALMCRLHLDRIKMFGDAVRGLDATISPLVARYAREAELLGTIPGFGEVVTAGWLGSIGPAPHQHFATAGRLASWITLCPGNYISARKSRSGRTGDGGNYIKPLLVQAAWAAIRVPGRLQARFHRLVRKSGGPKNKGREEAGDHRDRAHPCSRSPAPSSRPASRTRSPVPTSTAAASPPRPARNTCCASCRNSAPAASSPSPPRRRPGSAGPLIPDHLPGAAPPPALPAQTSADGTNRRRLLPRAQNSLNYVSEERDHWRRIGSGIRVWACGFGYGL